MDFVIIGSGGAIPIPRPFCQCKLCASARKTGYNRNNCSAFLSGANVLFDCGESTRFALNEQNIKRVDALFISHWHPDHTLGLRDVVEANYDFRKKKPKSRITVFMSKKTLAVLREKFAMVDFFCKVRGGEKPKTFEHAKKIKISKATITPIGFQGKNSEKFGFLLEAGGKRLFYSPCDTFFLKEEFIPKNLDFWVTECGMFTKIFENEITFKNLLKRIKKTVPKKTILTHLEEIELHSYGDKYLAKLERKYKGLNLRFAFDGMKIKL